jgi:hypothetical protein
MNNPLEEYVQLMNATPEEMIHYWTCRAAEEKYQFLHTDLTALKKRDEAEYLFYLNQVYAALAFFPFKEVRKKLASEGFTLFYQQWFIPLSDILKELENIASDREVEFGEPHPLILIKAHINNKIQRDLLLWQNYTSPLNGKRHTTLVKKVFYNLYRKRTYHAGKPLHLEEEHEIVMNKIINELEKIIGDSEMARKIILQITDGNTKKIFLRGIVEDCIEHPRTDAFYRRFFRLFRLICPDEELWGKEEFNEISIRNGEDSLYLETSYKSYQAKRIKDIIG